MSAETKAELFWDIVEPMYDARVSRSTMMGFPCVRIDGDFFASLDHRSGDLIVKLPSARVEELIESGVGQPFAPAGRKFKEWAAIPKEDEDVWSLLINEARTFVEGQ